MSEFAQQWVNLASTKLGATAVSCSDDFFAPMVRMLNDAAPVFIEDKYDDHGKWMDGWESRRKRTPGHDWCIVRLARPGVIHGIEISTAFFTGNYAPAASVEACLCDHEIPDDDQQWTQILDQSTLSGDAEHSFAIGDKQIFSHLRLHIYPDGGIARLRVYAEPRVDWQAIPQDQLVDIASALNGAVALDCNDQHYGDIRNLLAPGRGINMGDGWETRRRREPGNDWVTIALAHAGTIKQIEIDTAHFKGNYPDRCEIRAALLGGDQPQSISEASAEWPVLLPQSTLQADHVHEFNDPIIDLGPVSHVRINIFPDGGLSRVRLHARVAP